MPKVDREPDREMGLYPNAVSQNSRDFRTSCVGTILFPSVVRIAAKIEIGA